MNDILSYKHHIQKTLITLLTRDKIMLKDASSHGDELVEQIANLAISGKMVRGSLYVWMCHALGLKDVISIFPIAAAFELFQTGILIHDDVMDQDDTRRGSKTLHATWAKKSNPSNNRYGENVAIAAGDICYFLGFSWIHQTEISAGVTSQLSDLFGKEYATVGMGQLDDISFGITKEPDQEEILTMYRYKTARYTFSLPLMAACVTVNKPHLVLKAEQLGEHIGLAYQLRDDMIDLLDSSGKTKGSDIQENKFTLFRALLFEQVSHKQKQKLQKIFGNKKTKQDDIDYVIDVAQQYKIIPSIQQSIESHTNQGLDTIHTLPIHKKDRDILIDFVKWLATRNM